MRYFRNQRGDVSAYSQTDLDTAAAVTKGTPQVFHDIKTKLKNMVELKGAALKEHLNPTPTTEQLAEQAFAQRTALLKEIDAIATHPLRWAEISEDDKASIGQYRLDVIDINNQPGFPHSINWPAKPSVIK